MHGTSAPVAPAAPAVHHVSYFPLYQLEWQPCNAHQDNANESLHFVGWMWSEFLLKG